MIASYCKQCGASVGCNRRCKRCYPDPAKAPAAAPGAKAVTPFEKWWDDPSTNSDKPRHELMVARAVAERAWLACAAEAERLCRERALAEDASIACNCADAIAKLAEVDRG